MEDPKPDCLVPQMDWPQLRINLATTKLQGRVHALLLIDLLECPCPWLTRGVDECVVLQWTGRAYLSIWDDLMLFERNGQEPIQLDEVDIQQMAIHVNEFFLVGD